MSNIGGQSYSSVTFTGALLSGKTRNDLNPDKRSPLDIDSIPLVSNKCLLFETSLEKYNSLFHNALFLPDRLLYLLSSSMDHIASSE